MNRKSLLLRVFSWAAVFFCIAFVFLLSSQDAIQSFQLSTGVTDTFVTYIARIFPGANPDLSGFSVIIRKYAHFVAFFVLGLLVIHVIGRSRIIGYWRVISAFGFCVLFAVSDETHQLFVPGREAQLRDVFIDSAGSACGIAAYLLYVKVLYPKVHSEDKKTSAQSPK